MKKISIFMKSLAVLCVNVILCMDSICPTAGAFLYTSSQYNKLYNEKVALEIELQSLKQQYGDDKANLDAIIRDFNNRLDNLNRENDAQKKQMANLRNEFKNERDKHLQELADLKSNYERNFTDMNKTISNLNNELSGLQKFNEKQKKELERMEEQAKEFEKKLADEIKKGDITLKRFQDRLIINIDDRICFDSGSSELKKDVMPALQKITAILISYPDNRIIVEGHTDNVPISTIRFRDNWQLSTERALSVLNYLLRNKKLNPTRFSAAGYGEYNPLLPNNTVANRALNRRVDIVVIPRSASSKK